MQVPSSTHRLVKEPGAEPVPGYRLIEPLGKGGFGEVWKCEAPGGLHKAIKFVQDDSALLGNEVCGAEQELRALQHVKTIRHPFLLSMDRVEHVGGELVIVMELADRSLHDLLVACRGAGQAGIARADALQYLREAAEVLDLMNQEHGLAHLDIKPRNLFLVHNHIKVADFGLVNSLAERAGQDEARFQLGAITPLYAAPEIFLGKISASCDQYSLAIVYCELLTGHLPFTGKNFRMLALQHTSGKPDLAGLDDGDHPIVLKALAKDPRQRHASCSDFIQALLRRPEPGPALPVDTRSETASAGTRTDVPVVSSPVVEQRRTAAIARPTKVLSASGHVPRIPLDGSAAVEAATLDGFHFLECLGRSPLGEMWTVETPEGQRRLVKLVNTFSQASREEIMREATVAAQLRAIKHRSLLAAHVLPHTANRLAVITAPVRESLASRLQECQSRGQPGIPRLELLGYLLTAAKAMDELQGLYGLQHLGLSPRNLLLVERELQIADFGLMALVWMPAGQQAAQINPRYSAPELFARRFSHSCDQYSLALIYYELLTGDQVHGTRTPAQLAKMRGAGLDTLDLLPAPDRLIVGKALHPQPDQRYPSSTDFVHALLTITPGGAELLDREARGEVEAELAQPEQSWVEELLPPSRSKQSRPVRPSVPATRPANLADPDQARRLLADLVKQLAGNAELREFRGATYFHRSAEEIEHRCHAHLVPGTLRLKLAGFVEQWGVQLVADGVDRFLFQMRLKTSLWRTMIGRQPGLDIDIRSTPPTTPGATLSEVTVVIRPAGCGRDEGAQSLLKWGPALIDSLRTALQAGPDRRRHPRHSFTRPITVKALLAGGEVGPEIRGRAKDLSLEGIGLYLPQEIQGQIVVQLQRSDSEPPLDISAQVVRTQRLGDGHFEVGARFVLS